MKDEKCMLHDCLNGGLKLSAILYIMLCRASLRRSSKLRKFKCCNMSPTVDVFRCLLTANLA